MPSTKTHENYKRTNMTFKVEEGSEGWNLILDLDGNGWGLGVNFPNEEYATKAGQAILDYSFYKPPVDFTKSKSDEKPKTRKRPAKKAEKNSDQGNTMMGGNSLA